MRKHSAPHQVVVTRRNPINIEVGSGMINRVGKWISAIGVGAVAALALSACAAGGEGGSGGGADGSADPIVIGVVGAFTGPFASTTGTGALAVEAWEKYTNAQGGIDGRDVKVIVKETGVTTGAGLRGAQELISQEGAVAIVDFDYSGDSTWLPLAEEANVPVVLPWSGFGSLTSQNVFQLAPGPVALAYSSVGEQVTLGADTGGIALIDGGASVIDGYIKMWQHFADDLDFDLSPVGKLPDALPDYTVFCQQLKDAGAQSYSMTLTAELADKIITQCYGQGIEIPVVLQATSALPSWKTNPAYEGSPVVDLAAPSFDESIPGIVTYRSAMDEYHPGLLGSDKDNSYGPVAWASLQLVAKMVGQVDGDVSGEAVRDQLWTVKDETLDGLVGPLTYVEGENTANNCYFVWQITDGEYVSSAEPTCVPDEIIAPAQAALLDVLGMG